MIESEIKPIGNTMYRSQQFDEDNSFLKILAVFLLVPVMLLAARFINLGLWYNVTKMELSNNTQLKQVGDYTFIGYSSYENARVKTINTAQLSTKKLTACVYFDWYHPVVVLIHNEGARIFINLGRVAVYPEPGLTSYFVHLAEILETGKEKKSPKAIFFGSCLFPKFTKTIAAQAAAVAGGVGERTASGKGI
ncbi:MAG: hypothetical protein GY757_49080, partial [bacterium]|nr:hypothetical protein [bacterium]